MKQNKSVELGALALKIKVGETCETMRVNHNKRLQSFSIEKLSKHKWQINTKCPNGKSYRSMVEFDERYISTIKKDKLPALVHEMIENGMKDLMKHIERKSQK